MFIHLYFFWSAKTIRSLELKNCREVHYLVFQQLFRVLNKLIHQWINLSLGATLIRSDWYFLWGQKCNKANHLAEAHMLDRSSWPSSNHPAEKDLHLHVPGTSIPKSDPKIRPCPNFCESFICSFSSHSLLFTWFWPDARLDAVCESDDERINMAFLLNAELWVSLIWLSSFGSIPITLSLLIHWGYK